MTPQGVAGRRQDSAGDVASGIRQRRVIFGLLAFGLIIAALFSLAIGPVSLSLDTILDALWAPDTTSAQAVVIVWAVRLPRTVLAVLVGASLAVAGTLMQGLFRNPLADPGLAGVSSGASLAAVSTIVMGAPLATALPFAQGLVVLPVAAFLGALSTTVCLYMLATRQGVTSTVTMLLGGIALAALAGAITGLMIFLSDDQQLRDFTFWSLGGLGGASWAKIAVIIGPIGLCLGLSLRLAHGLNALALGEAAAFYSGVPPEPLKRACIVFTSILTGCAVAVSGTIGFIGIVVPHLLRLAFGADHRFLLGASALFGASLLLIADIIARTIAAPAELPIGILTAVIGAPLFLWLLLNRRPAVEF
jgi:iron complex transport system permease protein